MGHGRTKRPFVALTDCLKKSVILSKSINCGLSNRQQDCLFSTPLKTLQKESILKSQFWSLVNWHYSSTVIQFWLCPFIPSMKCQVFIISMQWLLIMICANWELFSCSLLRGLYINNGSEVLRITVTELSRLFQHGSHRNHGQYHLSLCALYSLHYLCH